MTKITRTHYNHIIHTISTVSMGHAQEYKNSGNNHTRSRDLTRFMVPGTWLRQSCGNKKSLTPKGEITQLEAYLGTKPSFAEMNSFKCLSWLLLQAIELSAKLLDYSLLSTKSNINRTQAKTCTGIDRGHSFSPQALTEIYMGQHTIHCMTKQIIQTSNAAGYIHITMTFHIIKVHPDIYPGKPTTTI